jgi:choline dehydrogenase-like flavoprotein
MFVDARTVPDGSLVEVDVCIVGAGAAGITIARELRGAPLRVALLESGWLTPDAVTQSLYAGSAPEQPYFPLDAARTRCFGGTTNEWAGECRPLDALDFEERDWVPASGWPFRLGDLRPFYERAQSVCQLGRFDYAAADRHGEGVRSLALDGGRILTRTIHHSPPTRFGETYRVEIRRAANVVAYLRANVVDLETPTPPTQVSAVRVACLSGTRFRVAARIFILATGGIENARLLLMSNRVQSAGLGNGHDLVGRYFMEHLYLDRAATIVARKGRIGDFYTFGHWFGGRRVRGILGLAPEVQRRERLTNYCAVLDEDPPRLAPISWRSLLNALRHGRVTERVRAYLQTGIEHHGGRTAAARPDGAPHDPSTRLYLVKNVMEQAPNPESRVVLDRDKDQLGCPRVELRWRLCALDKRTAHRAHQILAEDLARSGIGSLESALGRENDPWPPALRGARHHMGTTRMHPDPRRGIVDADGRVHGIANLYVAGSSVFPTSGSANPTLTIVALALRLAEHVRQELH